MAGNAIQMQKGLSLTRVQELYGTDAKCAAVKTWRWPNSFICPHRGSQDHVIVGARYLYLCHGCRT